MYTCLTGDGDLSNVYVCQSVLPEQMGFDGLFFGRLDYQDKQHRIKSKSMEMVWKGSPTNLSKCALRTYTGV